MGRSRGGKGQRRAEKRREDKTREEKRREAKKKEERRSEKRKSQKKEHTGAKKVDKSRNTMFFPCFGVSEGRKVSSLKPRARSQLAR